MAVATLCPKFSFLAQRLRAVAYKQTHRQRKQNFENPFFCYLFFFIIFFELSLKIRSTYKNKDDLLLSFEF